MERTNKETVGSKGSATCCVHQLVTADNIDNTNTLHYIHHAEAIYKDFCLEYLEYFSSSICAEPYQCFLCYKLLFSLRIPKEMALIIVYNKQELRSLSY